MEIDTVFKTPLAYEKPPKCKQARAHTYKKERSGYRDLLKDSENTHTHLYTKKKEVDTKSY